MSTNSDRQPRALRLGEKWAVEQARAHHGGEGVDRIISRMGFSDGIIFAFDRLVSKKAVEKAAESLRVLGLPGATGVDAVLVLLAAITAVTAGESDPETSEEASNE